MASQPADLKCAGIRFMLAWMRRSALILFFATVRIVAAREIDLGEPALFTPYDSAMAPVREVLERTHHPQRSFESVAALLQRAHSFGYERTKTLGQPPPAAAPAAGDCKTKSLWLCGQIGDPEIRFVVGKLTQRSRRDHAWLLWRNENRWWILDPANAGFPIAADDVPVSKYLPYYSYARAASYRHKATSLLIASTVNTR